MENFIQIVSIIGFWHLFFFVLLLAIVAIVILYVALSWIAYGISRSWRIGAKSAR